VKFPAIIWLMLSACFVSSKPAGGLTPAEAIPNLFISLLMENPDLIRMSPSSLMWPLV
jgi:hypothetical protein